MGLATQHGVSLGKLPTTIVTKERSTHSTNTLAGRRLYTMMTTWTPLRTRVGRGHMTHIDGKRVATLFVLRFPRGVYIWELCTLVEFHKRDTQQDKECARTCLCYNLSGGTTDPDGVHEACMHSRQIVSTSLLCVVEGLSKPWAGLRGLRGECKGRCISRREVDSNVQTAG